MNLKEARAEGKSVLVNSETPELDTRVLLCRLLNLSVSDLFTSDISLNAEQERAFKSALKRRSAGEPVAYITGEKEFFGRTFEVTPSVLIPRPDTEILVEAVLNRTEAKEIRLLDICTGTGCIGITLKEEFAKRGQNCALTLSDISTAVLNVAARNAGRLTGECEIVKSDLLNAFEGRKFDVITANPPYIADKWAKDMRPDVLDFEPPLALFADKDGMDLIQRLIPKAAACLEKNGLLIVECDYRQAQAVKGLLEDSGFAGVFIEKDLSGLDRCVGGRHA